MRRYLLAMLLSCCLASGLAACPDDDTNGSADVVVAPDAGTDAPGDVVDVGAVDAGEPDSAPDLPAPVDGGAGDAAEADSLADLPAPVDGGAGDAAEADSAADLPVPTDAGAAPADADEPDAGTNPDVPGPDVAGCTYFSLPLVLSCGPEYQLFLHWSDWGDPACPTYYTSGPTQYDTLVELAAAAGCDTSCVYEATVAVDFLTCDGPKSGYEVYEAEPPCPDVYSTPAGIFEDLCMWDQYACYCDGGG